MQPVLNFLLMLLSLGLVSLQLALSFLRKLPSYHRLSPKKELSVSSRLIDEQGEFGKQLIAQK